MAAPDLSRILERAVRRTTGAKHVHEGDHIQTLWGGYGEITRIELEGANVPRVIAKQVSPPGGTKRSRRGRDGSHDRKLASYAIELEFYEQFAKRLPTSARVPELLSGQTLEGAWLFVLEDLDAAGFPERRRMLPPGDIEACLSWLASFHATFMGTAPKKLWKVGTYWHLATRQDELAIMKNANLKRAAAALDSKLNGGRFKTLVHGDAKTANFCFPSASGDAVAAVDFQYVGGGCGMKDVAYFFDCCLAPHEATHEAPSYLDYYFERLRHFLAQQQPAVDASAVEAEWRALYPVAWADFYRFLDGWAPGHYAPEGHAADMVRQAFSSF